MKEIYALSETGKGENKSVKWWPHERERVRERKRNRDRKKCIDRDITYFLREIEEEIAI